MEGGGVPRGRIDGLRPGHVMLVAVAVVGAFLAFVVGLRLDAEPSAGPAGSRAASVGSATDDVVSGSPSSSASSVRSPVPTPDRPAAVGVRRMTFTDTTRSTPARGGRPRTSSRSLPVTIRYPTAGRASADEIADAPSLGAAPLVVFGHGFNQSAARYATLLHDLASFGFVVVAPEFPMSSSTYDGTGDAEEVPEQARDVSFLITSLTGPSAPAELAGSIVPGPVGLMGQSDGAVTSLLVAFSPKYADARVGAVVAVSGDWNTFGGNWYSTQHPPVVAVHGDKDEINPFYSSEWIVSHHPGSAMLVSVQGASHLGAVVDSANAPAVARLAAYEFEWRLQDVPGAAEATRTQANTPPLKLVVDHG